MDQDIFDQKITLLHHHLQMLQRQTNLSPAVRLELPEEVVEELSTAMEELYVAQEESRQQNDELVAIRQIAEAERQRYQELFEFAPDGYVVTDAQGTIREANRAAAALLQAPPGFLVGKPLVTFILEEDREALLTYLIHLQKKIQPVQEWEVRCQPQRGEPFSAALTVAPGRDSRGQMVTLRCLLRDITLRKQEEEKLREAKEAAEAAARAKSEFLATISHELRTPLNVILGYDDLLLEGEFGLLTTEQLRPLRRVNENARELLNLICAVLDVSRLEAGQLPVEIKEVRVPDLLEEIKAETQSLQEKSRLAFVWQIEDELPLLHTDPDKLKIVLKNLIGNAVKFTEQGSITVTAQGQEEGVVISVTDTGVGIPREALALIFEPFRQVDGSVTRQYGGTGLGLHIVKRFLELLGGRVTVESEVGRGSTFRVWAPTLAGGEKNGE